MKDSQRKAMFASKKIHYLVYGTVGGNKSGKGHEPQVTVETVILATSERNAKELFNLKTKNFPPAKTAKITKKRLSK